MPRRPTRIVVLGALGALLALPTAVALSDSRFPFAQGNPLESLSEKVDNLERRVAELENPAPPLAISGLYSVTTTGYCLYTIDAGLEEYLPPTGAITYRINGHGQIRSFVNITTERYDADGTITNLGPNVFTSVQSGNDATGTLPAALLTSELTCGSYSYTMSGNNDGTFTQTIDTTGCPEVRYQGRTTLQGQAWNGGKTLTLISTTLDKEMIIAFNPPHQRICVRTSTARKISD